MSAQDKSNNRLLNEAMDAHRSGRLAEAKALYEKSLSRHPRDSDSLHFYGVLRHNLGQSANAIELIQRSLQLAPANPGAWLNLGNIYMEIDATAKAKVAYERAVVLAPQLADAWYNLGICLRKSSEAPAAIAALERALELRPTHAPSLYQRGVARRECAEFGAAEADFRAALRFNPGYVEVYESLGMLLYRQGRIADAAEVYYAWLEHDPGSSTARYLASAMSGRDAPQRAPDDYVTETFNAFAPTFEQNLTQLGYRAPELVSAALIECIGPATRLSSVLDAGCGTGLCGSLLRPITNRLVGVDLSLSMIEKARAKKCYDELHVGELCAFMRERSAAFDAVVAADTVVYFGALEEVLASASACLVADGLLVLTLEKMSGDTPVNFCIEPHGRYAHRPEYVRAALQHEEFELLAVTEQVLRRERDEDVRGLVVSARAGSQHVEV